MTPLRRRSWLVFPLSFLGVSVWLLLLNLPHMGVNASLHWDAEASLTYGPTLGDRTTFDAARAHLFDPLQQVRGDDPRRIYDFYWSAAGQQMHGPLTDCRKYYSFVSDWLGHAGFEFGRRYFNSPVAAVICYQISSLLVLSLGLSMLIASGLRRIENRWFRAAYLLFFAAVTSTPIYLSLSRQMLQETPGFTLVVLTLFAATAAVTASKKSTATDLAVAAGVLTFLTLRTRYTLGPAVGLLLPVFLSLNVKRFGARNAGTASGVTPPLRLAVLYLTPLAVCLGVDCLMFGPMILPWVYDAVMVRSTKLYFHAEPPYVDFFNSLFLNAAPVALCLLAVGIFVFGEGRPTATRWAFGRHLSRAIVSIVVVILSVMIWRTASQQVRFQPRHLFLFLATMTVLAAVTLPRARPRFTSAAILSIASALALIWNLSATFRPLHQPTNELTPLAFDVISAHWNPSEKTAKRSVFRDLWWENFDWSDQRLLRDPLVAWQYLARQKNAVVMIDSAADKANKFEDYAAGFYQFGRMKFTGRCCDDAIATARRELARGRPVFLFTAPGRSPPSGVMESHRVESLGMLTDTLRLVTAVTPAVVYLKGGATEGASRDGLSLTKTHGGSGAFAPIYSFIPHVQPEHLTFDTDTEFVEYEFDGGEAGTRYELGFTTWDPDDLGRAMSVETGDGKTLLEWSQIAPHAPVKTAATDVLVTLPSSGRQRIIFKNHGRGGVVVCEVWVREVQ